jgi:hypothetical protein
MASFCFARRKILVCLGKYFALELESGIKKSWKKFAEEVSPSMVANFL